MRVADLLASSGVTLLDRVLSDAAAKPQSLSPSLVHHVYTLARALALPLTTPEATLRRLLATAAAAPAAPAALAPFADATAPFSARAAAAAATPRTVAGEPPRPPADCSELANLTSHAIDVPGLLATTSAMAPTALADALLAAGPVGSHAPGRLEEVVAAFPAVGIPEVVAIVTMIASTAGACLAGCLSMR